MVPLPPYARRVEYLESTGTQWIDTGVAIPSGCVFEKKAKFSFTSLSSSSRNTVDGSFSNSSGRNNRAAFITTTSSNNYLQIAVGGGAYATTIERSSLVGNVVDLCLNVDDVQKTVSATNGSTSVLSTSYTGSIVTDTSQYLFARSTQNGSAAEFSYVRIFSYALSIDGVTVRDYVPVLKDGVGYLFDRVSGQLFGNQGTGDFVLGPYTDRVPLPPYARRIEYLESTGTQYVDTGVAPTTTLSLDCSGYFPNTVPGARFGSRRSAASECFYVVGVTTGNMDVERFSLGLSGTGVELQRYADPKPLRRFVLDAATKSASLEYADGTSGSLSFSQSAFAGSYPIFLLAANLAGTASHSITGTRLSACRILDGSTLVRSFVPCRVLDVGYLWDEVNGVMYGNPGTGDFVLGPDVREGVVPTPMNPFGVGRRQEEIRRVEYLESTGTQWIDAGVLANGEFEFDYRFYLSSVSGNTVAAGARSSSQFLTILQVVGSSNNSFIVGYLDSTIPVSGTTVRLQTMRDYDVHISFANGSQSVSLDGVTVYSASLSGTEKLDLPIYLYKRSHYSTDSVSAMIGRFYYFKIWQNGTLVRDFVPVAIGSTGYLLDRVSGQLFGNQGTGDFVLGPDIVPVEYVESTGSQYVDTGIVPGNGTTYDIRFQRTRTNATESIFGLSSPSTVVVMQRILGLSTKIEIARGGSGQAKIVNITNDTNWHTVLSSATEIVVDGVATSRDFSASTAPYSLYVFAQQATAGAANAYAKARISRLQISDGSTLVRDFQPVRVGTEGALYDRVTDTVFRSATSTPLVAGPETRW